MGAWAGGDVKFFIAIMSLIPIYNCLHPFSFISIFLNAAMLVIPLTLGLIIINFNEKIYSDIKKAIILSIKSTTYALPFLLIFYFVFNSDIITSTTLFFVFSLFSLLFSILRKQVLVKELNVNDLKEGDISKQTIYLSKGKVKYWDPPSIKEIVKLTLKGEIKALFAPKDADSILVDSLSAAGMSEEQIKELKRRGVKRILVKLSLPFIPLLAIGYLLSIVGWDIICVLVKQV